MPTTKSKAKTKGRKQAPKASGQTSGQGIRKKYPKDSHRHTPGSLDRYIRPEELPAVDLQEITYDNGLKVISERVEGSASVGLGLWVNVGSQDETDKNAGIAHFIEHVVFKGTAGRSMRDIMQSIEGRGGLLNAFTTKEHTCYYTWSRTVHLQEAVSVLFELATRPKFSERDLKREKGVVIEEIRGLEDEPDELVFDYFEKEIFGNAPLGKPIIGTEASINRLTQEDILKFHRKHYTAHNIVITASGAHHHDELFAAVELALHHVRTSRRILEKDSVIPPHKPRRLIEHQRSGGLQSHIIVGRKTLGANWEQQTALSALITLLGVGMGSRLNLRLREQLSLAYDATAFYSPFKWIGAAGLYVATTAENQKRTVEEMYKLLRGLFTNPVSKRELERTKEQLIGGLVLTMESVSNRMMRTGQNHLHYDRYVSIEEELFRVAKLTTDDVNGVAEKLFKNERALSMVAVTPSPEAQSKGEK